MGGPSRDDVEALRAAHERVRARIADACERARRDPAGVTLVAVSKTVPAGRLRGAVAAGLTVFGENRVQEAASKAAEVPGATWHLVGPLQSNKARRAVETFSVLETVDSVALAARLDRLASELRGGEALPILVQVNADGDPGKAGLAPADAAEALPSILDCRALDVRGLMTVGRLVATAEEARPTFRRLRELAEELHDRHPRLGPELSMGMSDDYEVAIEEGATIVRVGRALFGERPPR